MRKSFVLDTNVLLFDPYAIRNFRGNDVTIPYVVLEELEKHKKGDSEKAKAARTVLRFIDGTRELGSLHKGVKIEELDITLKVVMLDGRSANFAELSRNGSDKDYNDNIILAVVMDMRDLAAEKHKVRPILVTKDIALRVKADSVGVFTEDYKAGQVKEDIEEDVETYSAVGPMDIENLYNGFNVALDTPNLPVNSFLMLQGAVGPSAMCRVAHSDSEGSVVKRVKPPTVYGLTSRNREQAFSLDLLTDPNISCVALVGPAGTGKSIIALAAGLEQVVNKKLYKKVVVCRVPVPMGKDIGFLPGTAQEKLAPWLGMVTDNFEVLLGMGKTKVANAKEVKEQLERIEGFGMFEIASTSHIRGRSLPDAFIIVEEAQNASPHEIKSIISRAGKGTKVILLGDPDQIDVPYLDKYSNGLTYAVDRLRSDEEGRAIFGSVTLVKSERSKLAELVGRLL